METLTGKILVAMPGIGDPRFAQAVILLCAHGDEYAMGLVLNKPMDDLTLPQLLGQLDIEQDIRLPDQSILDGGPVGTDRGFVVHSGDYYCDGATIDVGSGICMTATRDVLRALGKGGAPSQAAMTLGYSGWGPGQLEHELAENAWIVSDSHEDIIFDQGHDTKWSRTLEKMGINAARLQHGGHA